MGYIRSLHENADILRSPLEIHEGSKLPSRWPFQVVFSLVEYTQGTDSSLTLREGLLARQWVSQNTGFVFGFWLYKTTQRNWFKRKKKKKQKHMSCTLLSPHSGLEENPKVWFESLTHSLIKLYDTSCNYTSSDQLVPDGLGVSWL